MNITVISTGEELLRGAVVNTDLAEIGQRLLAVHAPVTRAIVAGDRPGELLNALALAAREADVILVSGGLGPTEDDLTRDAAAEFFGRKLLRDTALADGLRRYYRRRHGAGHIPKALFRQADVPEGAEILSNSEGSAPGLYFTALYGGRTIRIFLLPGPPNELVPMLEKEVVPRLACAGPVETVRFLAEGLGELEIETRLTAAGCQAERAYCAVPGATRLFFTGTPETTAAAADLAASLFGKALSRAADPAEACVRRLAAGDLTLGLAESCTGGMIAEAVTRVPGASQVFCGGIVAYANAVKNRVLGVPEEILRTCGAVSEPCARAMAEGAAKVLQCSIAGAVTGIAGPGGGTPEKPVGTVWIAVAFKGNTVAEEHHFSGGRETVRRRTCAALLELIRKTVEP